MPASSIETVDANVVLEEAVRLFRQDSRINFILNLARELPSVRCDREELRRGCINIIRNGMQAMSGEGTPEVTSSVQGTVVALTFRDYGIGMSRETQSKLFRPNFSTKTDGMGLGLAITKKSIDDVGGSIHVESSEGEGTVVTISVPVPPKK